MTTNTDREAFAELDKIRVHHAPEDYEFETDQTYCPSSDVATEYCDTCNVLAAVDVIRREARLAALREALAVVRFNTRSVVARQRIEALIEKEAE